MISSRHALRSSIVTVLLVAVSPIAFAQTVDTKSLSPLGEKWRDDNPYRANKDAVKVGMSAYAQNCARCHGIDAVSGGIAPDLRQLDRDCVMLKDEVKKQACYKDVDTYYATSVRRGKTRNGAVYMPPFEGMLNQEAIWSIKAYLETVRPVPAIAAASPDKGAALKKK